MAVHVAAAAVQFRNIGVENVIAEFHGLRSPCFDNQPDDFSDPSPSHIGTLKIGGFIKGVK
jgi:hypothetical protein